MYFILVSDFWLAVLKEAVAQTCSVKNVFLEISQNSQGKTCVSLFFNKVAGPGQQLY